MKRAHNSPKGSFLPSCLIVFLLVCSTPAFAATTWNVPGDCLTIQAAIGAAANGDTVLVQPGTYVENINFVGKAITVTSTIGPDDSYDCPAVADTIIDGNQAASVVRFVSGEGPDSVLRGFTIRNGNQWGGGIQWWGGGIHCTSSSPTIAMNSIIQNVGRGIHCRNGSSATIDGNEVSQNQGGGISVFESSAVITGNRIADNTASYHAGLSIDSAPSCLIEGNTITGNVAQYNAGGIECSQGSPRIIGNIITDNQAGAAGASPGAGGGILCYDGASPQILRNTIMRNVGTSGGGIYCSASSSPTITGNTISGNEATTGGGGGIGTTGTTGCSPAITGNTIEDNVAASRGGGIGCAGGYVSEISDNTIRGNRAGSGAGINVGEGGSPSILGNIIENNTATGWGGGGINCSTGEIRNNQIANNTAENGGGAGIQCRAADEAMVIENNQIAQNTGDGVFCVGSSPIIGDNEIIDNTKSGVILIVDTYQSGGDPDQAELDILSEPTITGNTISDSGEWGINCVDTAAANAATLETENTFVSNGLGQVVQQWVGLVRAVDELGDPVAGAEVSLFNDDGDTQADAGSPWSSGADGYAPDTADPDNVWTWRLITEWLVDNGGVRSARGPQQVAAALGVASGSASRSWNGRYQIAEVMLKQGPLTSAVLADPNPAEVGSDIVLAALVDDTDAGGSDVAAAEYRIGDGEWMAMDAQDGGFDSSAEPVTATIPGFGSAGVHMIAVRGTDAVGAVGPEETVLLAVYDPSAGFVSGGGWIESPEGAYAPDTSLTGKAHFGFVSKYQKGADVPEGQTQFRFKTADLAFQSTSYQWLVVAGTKAKFKGEGTINGEGEYGFMLTATDGESKDDPDKFRIKIWEKGTEDVMYDNQMGDGDDGEATDEIEGGNIVVHSE